MRLSKPTAALSTTPRRLIAALVLLFVAGVAGAVAIPGASALLSGTTANNSTYAASSCFLPVPVSMVGGNAFSPASLTIKAGCSVKWTNTVSQNHNSTSNPAGTWASQDPMGQNATYTYQFLTTGTFPYRCTRHSGVMTGTITVN